MGILSGVLLLLGLALILPSRPGTPSPAGRGWDLGGSAELDTLDLRYGWRPQFAGWWRISHLPRLGAPRRDESVASARAALREIRMRNGKILVKFRAKKLSWKSGTRTLKTGAILPLDLREAHDVARELAATYGDRVDAWEVENEPEIAFVPENGEHYAAYLKAMWLGFHRGFAENAMMSARPNTKSGDRSAENNGIEARNEGRRGDSVPPAPGSPLQAPRSKHPVAEPRVLMAPLALPPGPHWANLVDNDVLSYSDGFNFHYYGYAEDFSAVYRQHEAALVELTKARLAEEGEAQAAVSKRLPVFVSEYGYGTLGAAAAGSVAGRVAQWRWFRRVYDQIGRLRIEAPMVFQLQPYLEREHNEFGLLVPSVSRPPARADVITGPRWHAGGLTFRPQDFDVGQAEPWMDGIGRTFAGFEVTPALAWLLAQPSNPAEPRPFEVKVPAPSTVVIDLVTGSDVVPAKGYRGHFLARLDGDRRTGRAELRVYNFGSHGVAGRLDLGPLAVDDAGRGNVPLELAPGAMATVAVRLNVPGERFAAHRCLIRFLPGDPAVPAARYVTLLYPEASHLRQHVVGDLISDDRPRSENERRFAALGRMTEEPASRISGSWRVTDGVEVSEDDGVWRFTVTGSPAEPLHPAAAELILPDGFGFPPESLLEMELRAIEPDSSTPPVQDKNAPRETSDRAMVTLDVRTDNGNRYTVWPPLAFTQDWRRLIQASGNFSMGFYGRAELPWAFEQNRAVALVFRFTARTRPMVFEVRRAKIVEYRR